MICKEYETITEKKIPVIHCYPEGAKNLPLVLVNHGTGGSAEAMVGIGTRLAEKGCFCVVIDAVWHGKRADKKLQEMFISENYKAYYLELLLTMANDMTKIIDLFETDERVDATRVGMTGISQGGYVAFMTMTKDDRITAASPMIGSPDLTDKYGYSPDWESIPEETRREVLKHSPLNHYEKMAHVKLLVQDCDADTIVPVTGTRRLDEKLKPMYGDSGNYSYIEYPGLGHEVPEIMIDRAINWLAEKL